MDQDTLFIGIGAVFLLLLAAIVFSLIQPSEPTLSISTSFSCPTLTVLVTNPEGNPEPSVSISIIYDENVVSTGSTDEDGVFSTSLSKDGNYVIKAEKGGFRTQSVSTALTPSTCSSQTPTGTQQSSESGSEDTQNTTQQDSNTPLQHIAVMLSLLILVFLFYVFLFMLSKAISSPFLEQTSKAGILDSLLVAVLVILVMPLIENNTLLDFSATFVNYLVPADKGCPISDAGVCDVKGWYSSLVSDINANFSSLLSQIDDQLTLISVSSGVISMSYQGAGLSFVETVLKDTQGEGAGIAASATPTPVTKIGYGGRYAFFTNMLYQLRASTTSLLTLMSFISALKELALETSLMLQIFMLGALLRAFSFSKGAGAFLMAFALSLNAVFIPSLILGFAMASGLDSGISAEELNTMVDDAALVPEGGSLERKFKALGKAFDIVDAPYPFQVSDAYDIAKRIFLDDNGNPSNISYLPFAIALYTLVLSFSLLLVVSASGGLSKLLGADVSIWIIGQLAEMV